MINLGSSMPRKQPLDQWIDQVVTAFSKLTRPQAVVGPVQFRGHPGSPLRTEQCRRRLGPTLGTPVFDGPIASSGVLPAGPRQIGPRTSSPTRCRHLFRSLAGLDPQGLAVDAAGCGAGCHQHGRRLYRLDLPTTGVGIAATSHFIVKWSTKSGWTPTSFSSFLQLAPSEKPSLLVN